MKKPQKLELRPFQKEDVAFIHRNNYNVLIANAPGTGKTIECLAAIATARTKLCPVVVICPASVLWNWHTETRKWCKWAKVHVITNTSTPLPEEKCHIYILSWALIVSRGRELLYRKPRLLIADEAHFAKNRDAMRSKALFGLARRIPHRLLLTGTPLINRKQELENLKEFFGTVITDEESGIETWRADTPPMIRRLLHEVAPDIPPKHRLTLPVYLTHSIAREYRYALENFEKWLRGQLRKKMENEGEADRATERALAAEGLVKLGYLRRLCGLGKVDAAVEFAGRAIRIGEPVVFFAEHANLIKKLSQGLKIANLRHVIINGSTPKARRKARVDQFQAGEVPIFIGSKAAGTGITFTKAAHLVFLEMFYTSAEIDQAEDRIRRIGQKRATHIWFLHARGTIDDRLVEIVTRKRRLIEEAIGNEEIIDTPERNVLEMMATWSKEVSAPVLVDGDSCLGLGRSLPPLPLPSETCRAIFRGKKWNKRRVLEWGRMNGYEVQSVMKTGKGYTITVNNPSRFIPGSFKSFKVSKAITIVRGRAREASRKYRPKSAFRSTKTKTRKKG